MTKPIHRYSASIAPLPMVDAHYANAFRGSDTCTATITALTTPMIATIGTGIIPRAGAPRVADDALIQSEGR